MPRHDIIVVGASAGGVRALSEMVAALPHRLEASVFIVLHVAPTPPSLLPQILARQTPLPVAHARDGEPIRRGRVYVAPPDHHLLVSAGGVRVTRGPRENGHRPAVDPLFRSAAACFGPRVVGVILSGTLDDGSAGLRAVKARGGTAVVQDPEDALYPGMPQNAIDHSQPDHVLPIEGIGKLLSSLAATDGDDGGEGDHSDDGGRFVPHEETEEQLGWAPADSAGPLSAELGAGAPSGFTCPECHGALWDVSDPGLTRFRCRVGHAYSAESMVAEQGKDVENALWIALRALEERVSLTRKLAARARRREHSHTAFHFDQQADDADGRAEVLRAVLRESGAFRVGALGDDEYGRDDAPAAGI